jgi:3',5'-cyclic AMP phosphodiesterase CpdA
MYTLAHLSDPHLAPLPAPRFHELLGKRLTGYLNWQRRKHIHDPATLAAVVADMKAQKPGHIAVTGDIVNISLPAEFSRGRAWLENLGAPQDVTFIPGNHDVYVRGAGALASREWGAFMRGDDGGHEFPFLRRRGPLAIVGTNTGVPTAPFRATGWLGAGQLARLTAMLAALKDEGLFRVVLIHHPPVSPRPRAKRLLDDAELLRAVAAQGCELILHGHDHLPMLNWLEGPAGSRVPAVGVPSASAAPGVSKADGGYNLYRVDGSRGEWTCEMVSRAIVTGGGIVEKNRTVLSG